MNIQLGGLKLIHTEKTGFIPITDMIKKPGSKLSLLTYKSLKGFMISLDVSAGESEYLGLTSNYIFKKPITSFILKFAVIAPNNDTGLPVYEGISKSSESMDSYYEEAKLQQTIWIKSISGGRPEICPPVANFSLFHNHNSINLCQFFQSKTVGDAKNVFDYLYNLISSNVNYGIGVIVMPKVENSITFGELIYAPSEKVSNLVKYEAYASVSAKIARLFIDIGVIHFDLHSGNALVYFKSDNTLGSLIIDFGRASNIMSSAADDYLSVAEKATIIQKKNTYYNQIFKMNTVPDIDKKGYMLSVLDYIAYLDHKKNQTMFNFSDPNRYQMDWFNRYPREEVSVKAFNILKRSIITDGLNMTLKTVNKYLNMGYILNLDRDISTFIVDFPVQTQSSSPAQPTLSASISQPQPPCDESTGFCAISGGKRRRKTRKNRKNRKNKKSRRNKKSRKN